MQTATDGMLVSAVSSSSFFAVSSAVTTGAAADVDGGEDAVIHKAGRFVDPPVSNNNNDEEQEEESYHNKSNVSLGSVDHAALSGDVGSDAAVKRPNSAGVPAARNTSIHPLALKGEKVVRPRTAGSSSQGRVVYPRSASGEGKLVERSRASASSRPVPEKGGCSMTGWTDEAPDSLSLLECRASVSVILPTLEEGSDRGDRR